MLIDLTTILRTTFRGSICVAGRHLLGGFVPAPPYKTRYSWSQPPAPATSAAPATAGHSHHSQSQPPTPVTAAHAGHSRPRRPRSRNPPTHTRRRGKPVYQYRARDSKRNKSNCSFSRSAGNSQWHVPGGPAMQRPSPTSNGLLHILVRSGVYPAALQPLALARRRNTKRARGKIFKLSLPTGLLVSKS